MNQTEQNAGGEMSTSPLTSYGLPARIDGVDVDQLLRTASAQRDEVLALHRQLAGEKLRADQGWARAEAKSRECIELRERIAAGAGAGDMHPRFDASSPPPVRADGACQSITVGFDDLMALARQLIAEQMDDVDEEFMAGRAHGIGSLHSEILTLAKRGALAQAQDETAGDAGAAPTCRSSEAAQLAAQIAAIVDRDTPPDSRDEVVDWDLTGKPITRRMVESFAKTAPRPDQLALELPTGAPVIRNVGGMQPAENSADPGDLTREALSAVSWLYRRLPHGYGRQQHIEVVIERLARETGTDIADLIERGPAPAEGGA